MQTMDSDLKAVLFDLDGVVFDTEAQYSVFWGTVCREYRPDIPGLEHQIKGQTLVQIFDAFFAEMKDAQTDIVRRLNIFEQQMDYGYVPGFVQFISQLRAQGVGTALATSSNQAKMSAVYRIHPEFAQMFDAILTSEDFEESKPSPDCYLKAAARVGAMPSQCVVCEDSFNGLRSGRAAGMAVLGLSTTNPADTIAPLCDRVVPDFVQFDIDECRRLLRAHGMK